MSSPSGLGPFAPPIVQNSGERASRICFSHLLGKSAIFDQSKKKQNEHDGLHNPLWVASVLSLSILALPEAAGGNAANWRADL